MSSSARGGNIPKAVVFGCAGAVLTEGEKHFFRHAGPFGLILFQRNCLDPAQIRNLIAEFRGVTGREDAPVFIDHEGGRVQRLRPPRWPLLPRAKMAGDLYTKKAGLGVEAARTCGRLMGFDLHDLGVTVNCAPLADVLCDETDPAIGDRAYSRDPDAVAACARACAQAMLEMGVLPVIKHFPGHGRASADPHKHPAMVHAPPEELRARDFPPFRALRDLPLGMTCHVAFRAIDELPCSLSSALHKIIREDIGFDGLLLSDDLAMKGLRGRMEDLARQALRAGSDIVLHCSGVLDEMTQVAAGVGPMSDAAFRRWERALSMRKPPPPFMDKPALTDRLDMLLGAAQASI